jgi:hypothetical protein
MVAFTQRKQGLHDMIASTAVIYKDPNKGMSGIAKILIGFIIAMFALTILEIITAIVLASITAAKLKNIPHSNFMSTTTEETQSVETQSL